MNTLRDHDTVIGAWLDDGPQTLPEETRQAITVGIRTVGRRRPGIIWRPLGRPQMSPFALALGSAAAVVVVAALALGIYVNRPGIGVQPSPTALQSPTASPAPTTTQLPNPQSSPQIARNGREVLRFTGDRSNGMGDLIAVDPETGDNRVLVEGLADIASASWSADGKWIAYKYTNGILKVVGTDGVPRQLTGAVTGERVLWGWAWSPDGARLSFRDVDGQFVYDAWTGLRTEGNFGLAVSPDGTKSLYGASGGAIHSVDVRTHEDSLLVQLPGDDLETVDGIEWSPDGSRLAILNDLNPGFHRLFVLNADGSDIRVLAEDAAVEGWDWSPDGTRLAFAESSEVELRIWVANADGTTPTLIGSQPNEDEGGDPVWSPDGSRIAFWTEPGEAFVIDADGSGGVAPLDALAYEDWRGGWYACSTCLFDTGF